MDKKVLTIAATLLAGAANFLPTAALAQSGPDSLGAGGPFDPISSRILSDPLYLPLTGQIYGESSYVFTRSNYDVFNGRTPGSQIAGTEDNHSLTQYLAYGLTDEFSLHAAISHDWNNLDRTASIPGAATGTHSEGFTNPIFGATYRLLDQAYEMPVNLDLSFDYAPDLISRQAPGNGLDGTVGAGRDRTDFSLAVGREMRAFTIVGKLTASHLGQQNYVSLANNNNFTQDSGWVYNLGVNTQTRLTDQWSIDAGLGYNFAEDLSGRNETLGLPFQDKTANGLTIGTGVNYAIMPGSLVAGVTYDYRDLTDSGTNYYTLGKNSQIRNHDAHVVGVNLRYVFD